MPEMYLYKLARTAPAWQEPGNGLSPPLATANSLGLIIPNRNGTPKEVKWLKRLTSNAFPKN